MSATSLSRTTIENSEGAHDGSGLPSLRSLDLVVAGLLPDRPGNSVACGKFEATAARFLIVIFSWVPLADSLGPRCAQYETLKSKILTLPF